MIRITPVRPVIRLRHLAIGLLLFIVLAACAGSETSTPTSPPPSPTATMTPTALPPAPTATFPPLTSATRPVVLESPFANPTETPIPPPINLPFGNLTVLEPGLGSQVTNPIRVIGYSQPTFQDRVQVRLIDDAGVVLDETSAILMVYPGNAGRFVTHLTFDIPGVSQTALLQIDAFDRFSGKLSQRLTQPLVLLSTGSARVLPGRQEPAQLAIMEPRKWAFVPPGTVHVRGGGWSAWGGPIQVQAIDRTGEVLDSTTVTLSTDQPGQIGTYEVDLSPELPYSQYGLLSVAELDPETGEPRFLQSVQVYFQR